MSLLDYGVINFLEYFSHLPSEPVIVGFEVFDLDTLFIIEKEVQRVLKITLNLTESSNHLEIINTEALLTRGIA